MIKFTVQGRNNYYAIDEYHGESCERFVTSFKTRKKANEVCKELNKLADQLKYRRYIMKQISKKEFYQCGGFSNPKLVRIMRGKTWRYYRYL